MVLGGKELKKLNVYMYNKYNIITLSCSKTCLKYDQNLVFKTDYHLMQVKSIAECSKGAFCNTSDLH